MHVFESISQLHPLLTAKKEEGKSIGFVPTMGALHKGHLSLIEKSCTENDCTVVSIFVNPTQFNSAKDFKTYPRTIDQDLKLLEQTALPIVVYLPPVKDIYPDGMQVSSFNFGGIEHQMEGKFRAGHFDGVGTVLRSFFTLLQPDRAYFGEKDFQQLQIVRKLVSIENLPIAIIGCPIHREPSGLAMSSRNKRLSTTQKTAATLLYRMLQEVNKQFGTKNAEELTQWVTLQFQNHPELTLEYFEIAEEATLKPATTIEPGKKYRAFLAVFAGDVRLIDNIALN